MNIRGKRWGEKGKKRKLSLYFGEKISFWKMGGGAKILIIQIINIIYMSVMGLNWIPDGRFLFSFYIVPHQDSRLILGFFIVLKLKKIQAQGFQNSVHCSWLFSECLRPSRHIIRFCFSVLHKFDFLKFPPPSPPVHF